MFCNYCGTPNPEVASFCRQCGKPIASRAAVSAPPQPPAPIAAAPVPAAAPGVPASTPVQNPASPQPYAREPRAASPPRRSTSGALTASIALLLVGAFIFVRARAERPRILKGHTNYISTVAFSPDGRIVASGSSDGTVKLWDAASGKWLRTLSSYDHMDWIAFSADGLLLAASGGYSSKGLDVWDVASGNLVRTLIPDAAPVGAPAFSPDGRLLAASAGAFGDAPAALHLWDAATGAEIKSFPGYRSLRAFSPDSRTLTAISPNNAIVLLDVDSGAEVRTFSHASGITFQALAFSPDGRLIATVDFSSPAINLWDAATGNQLRTITDTAAVRGIAFSPDSRQLASGSEDHTIKLWDVASGARRRTLSGNSDSVNTVAFSPDGRQLASGGADATVRLWPLPAAK